MCDINFFKCDSTKVDVIINSITLLDNDYVECKTINEFESFKLHKSLLPFKTIDEFKQFTLIIHDTEQPFDENNVECQVMTYKEFKSNWKSHHIATRYPFNLKHVPQCNGLLNHITNYYNSFQKDYIVNYGNPIKEIIAWRTKSYKKKSNSDKDLQRPILHIVDKNLNIDDYFWLDNDIRNFEI